MSLNLNSAPYYDDFDANKNYQRVLFKPGVAVQARELTQLQTILSDQLGQLSSYTLKDGAIISGCEERISSIRYIKITDVDQASLLFQIVTCLAMSVLLLLVAQQDLKLRLLMSAREQLM